MVLNFYLFNFFFYFICFYFFWKIDKGEVFVCGSFERIGLGDKKNAKFPTRLGIEKVLFLNNQNFVTVKK